jgi:TM2 domain-containing membrane protein YozV
MVSCGERNATGGGYVPVPADVSDVIAGPAEYPACMTTPPPPYGQDPTSPPPGQDPFQAPAGPPQDPYQPPPAYPQPPTYQVSGPPTYPVSGGGQPYSPYPPVYPGMPMNHGFDPATGQPYSDKSKVAAGLLQLLPGFFLALGGIGRLYAGQITIGVVQLVVSVLVWVMVACLFWLIFPFLLIFGTWLWAVIDGIIMLAGRPTDGQGRPLRA